MPFSLVLFIFFVYFLFLYIRADVKSAYYHTILMMDGIARTQIFYANSIA